MLPTAYRYTALNQSGASSDITVKEQAWKFASDGSVTYSAWATRIAAVTAADDAAAASALIDNATAKNIGANLSVSATGAGTAGVITVFLEFSPDGGSSWPSTGEGIPVGSLDAGDSEVSMAV